MSAYDSGPLAHSPVVEAALDVAREAAGNDAIVAFLAYMDEHYVGDYYIEGSLRSLLTMVRECL